MLALGARLKLWSDHLKGRLYWSAMGRQVGSSAAAGPAPVQVSLPSLFYYLYRKGGVQLLRGWLLRPRLRRCRGRLFVGKDVQVLFPSSLSVGRNVAIGDHVFLNCLSQRGITLGDNVRLREYTWVQATSLLSEVGVGLEVGDNTYIGPHCTLGAGGGITIGRDVTLGAYVDLLAEDHAFSDPERPINQQGVTRRGIVIEDDCWLGNKVIVLDGVKVGRGCVVGAGAVVTRDLPPYSVAVGNPARVVRSRQRTPPQPAAARADP